MSSAGGLARLPDRPSDNRRVLCWIRVRTPPVGMTSGGRTGAGGRRVLAG
jgi:hypothetical protein